MPQDIEVVATAADDLHLFFRELGRQGLRIIAGAGTRVIVTPSPFEPALAEFDRESLQAGRSWLMISADAGRPWVGPLFAPGAGVCFACFVRRLWLNGQTADPPRPAAPSAALWRLAAREAGNWIRTGRSRLAGAFIAVDPKQGETRHPVLPLCATCARPPIRLDRSSLVSPLTGLVESVDVDSVHGVFYRARARSSQVIVPDGAGGYRRQPPEMVGGKALTPAAAVTACLAEAVERMSLYPNGKEQLLSGAYEMLRGRAIDPRSLDLFSARQHRNRSWWVRRHGTFHWPGLPYDPESAIAWVEARHASTGDRRLVPAEACLLGYGGRFLPANSNGCAAGRTFDEAARNAIFELAERDAVAIWWYNRAPRPEFDWRRLASTPLRRLGELLQAWQRPFWLLDVTTDLRIPAVVAVSCNRRGERIAIGSGASLDPETAAFRALFEMCAHVSDLRGQRPSAGADRNEMALWSWWREQRLSKHPYLRPSGDSISPAIPRRLPRNGLEEAVRRVRAAGFDVFLYDHTNPALGIPVARAIAPGLRHWWAMFAPGRLYDAPVAMGWQTRRLTERQLNPIPYIS